MAWGACIRKPDECSLPFSPDLDIVEHICYDRCGTYLEFTRFGGLLILITPTECSQGGV